MQAYRVETVLQQDGTLTLTNLPLSAGAQLATFNAKHYQVISAPQIFQPYARA